MEGESRAMSVSGAHARIGAHGGKPCVVLGNESISLKVATSGCQIVSVVKGGDREGANPLWNPPWETTTAALRRLAARDSSAFSQAPADVLESEILGASEVTLCCDVFGAHSPGSGRAGLSFHGEAGLREFDVTHVGEENRSVTLTADMPESMLRIARTFTPCPQGKPVVKVTETITNLVGFQRAMGRSQHVSLEMMGVQDNSTPITQRHDGPRTTANNRFGQLVKNLMFSRAFLGKTGER